MKQWREVAVHLHAFLLVTVTPGPLHLLRGSPWPPLGPHTATANTKLQRVSGCPGDCYRGVHHVIGRFSTFRTQVMLQSSGSLKLFLRDAEAVLYTEELRYSETSEKRFLQSMRPSKRYTICLWFLTHIPLSGHYTD